MKSAKETTTGTTVATIIIETFRLPASVVTCLVNFNNIPKIREGNKGHKRTFN